MHQQMGIDMFLLIMLICLLLRLINPLTGLTVINDMVKTFIIFLFLINCDSNVLICSMLYSH